MRIRTLILALALSCGMTVMAEAKTKTTTHRVSAKRSKGYKQNRANKVKPRKAKTVKSHPRKA
jgi:hypothetical protein